MADHPTLRPLTFRVGDVEVTIGAEGVDVTVWAANAPSALKGTLSLDEMKALAQWALGVLPQMRAQQGGNHG